MLLRNDPRSLKLLGLMEGSDLAEVRRWWDEDSHGLFTNGDQDQMLWALETSGLMEDARIVDHTELNSRGHYYQDSLSDAFVMHFCGHWDKPLGVARFAERFGVGQELVSTSLLDEFSSQVRSPMGRLEYWARARRMDVVGRFKKRFRPLWHRIKEMRNRDGA